MKIRAIQFKVLASGESLLRCPQCKSIWSSQDGSEFEPCHCVRFLWASSELGDAEINYPVGFDRDNFENAYRQQHWIVYQDDEIVEGGLGSPDPFVLEQMMISDVDEVLFVSEIPDIESPGAAAFCIGLKRKSKKVNARKSPRPRRMQVDAPAVRRAHTPEWARSFVGRQFDVEEAEKMGWVDQNSSSAHFGVPSGPGVWLFKLGMGMDSPQCHIGKVWLRFLLVKLSISGSIKSIYTRVDEVFADGHGTFCTHDLLPHDISEALEVLGSAAPHGAPIALLN